MKSIALNAALYIRVSTDDQAELSPDAQKRLLLEYAGKNNLVTSEELIFIDCGISGRNADKRPEFQKMIAIAKASEHPIDIILVWKFSRFARNQEESIVYKSLLKKTGVEVRSVSEPLPNGMIGTLVERIFEWMDEYYSIRLSGEVIRGMTENALRGQYQSSPPLGYDFKGHKLVPQINPFEATIIKKIFFLSASNKKTSQIARELNSCGFCTRYGNSFEGRTVKYILQNPFYIGKVRWNYYNRKSRTYNDFESCIVQNGRHEPIIEKELWELVNQKLAKERNRSACRQKAHKKT